MEAASPEEAKWCCAALYETDWARLMLGDSFHPGGLRSTDRLALLLGVDRQTEVLDVACGRGASALHLATKFGCRITGIDLSEHNVAVATEAGREAGLEHLLDFRAGDGESIPLADNSVDVVMCECSFCTFPAKERAMAEIARVLRPAGRFGLSDLTRAGDLPEEIDGLLAWVACIADARPIDEYLDLLENAGLLDPVIEPHDEALIEMVRSIKQKIQGAELLFKLARQTQPTMDFGQAVGLAKSTERAVRDGLLGYALIVARRPHA